MKIVIILRSYYGQDQTFGSITVPANKYLQMEVIDYTALPIETITLMEAAKKLRRLSVSTSEEVYDDTEDVVYKNGKLISAGREVSGSGTDLSNVIYDSSNRCTGFTLNGVTYSIDGWGTSQVTISGSDDSVRLMLLDVNGRIAGVR